VKNNIKAVLVIAGLALAAPAHAYFITGQMLKDSLEAADRLKTGAANPQDEREAQFGRGFVAGVADSALDGVTYCSPSDSSLGKLNDVILAYLRAHPETMPKTASSVALQSLIAAYPCKKK